MKKIHVIGGGTFSHVRNHLAIAAPAFGNTAIVLRSLFDFRCGSDYKVQIHLTKMADSGSKLVTNQDVADLVDRLVADPDTKIIVMNAALCDYDGSVLDYQEHSQDSLFSMRTPSGKHETRLKTSAGNQVMSLTPADKIISRIRKTRKDIFLVAFKTTTGATPQEQYLAGLHLLKANSANLVLANDTVTRHNMVITPEEARYHEGDRLQALRGLADMAMSRSRNTFTRSTIVPGFPVPWTSELVPDNLREVVDHCIEAGAYKPFRGATVGHFAAKVSDKSIVTSARKHNFNKLREEGMVFVEYEDRDQVKAVGRKPSVGGMSQRIIFEEHPEMDCIVHFHCPPKVPSSIPQRSQRENECGSHQCGENTSRGLELMVPGIKAVYLDNHGPNIVFNRNTPAKDVIDFIDENFDLQAKTGGLVA